MKKNHWINIIVVILLSLPVGCAEPIQRITKNSLGNTATPIPSETYRAATRTLSPIFSYQSLTPMNTPIVQLSTYSPSPTLTADEAKILIFRLLQDNGNCQMPCLWGFTPNENNTRTFKNFIAKFDKLLMSSNAYVSASDFDDSGLLTIIYRENYVHVVVDFFYYKNMESGKLDLLGLHGYSMQEKGKDLDWLSPEVSPLYGDALFNQAFEYYLLPQILSNYGPPDQVLLAPFPDDPDRADITWHPFSLVLYYPARGIFVEYVSPRERVGNNYVGCPSKVSLSLAVWSPESDLTFKDIVQKAGAEINELNMEYFKPVDAATALTLDEFYRIFKNPQNTTCLETPISVWQAP